MLADENQRELFPQTMTLPSGGNLIEFRAAEPHQGSCDGLLELHQHMPWHEHGDRTWKEGTRPLQSAEPQPMLSTGRQEIEFLPTASAKDALHAGEGALTHYQIVEPVEWH